MPLPTRADAVAARHGAGANTVVSMPELFQRPVAATHPARTSSCHAVEPGPRHPEHREPSGAAGAARRGRLLGRRGRQGLRPARSAFRGGPQDRVSQGTRRVQRPTDPVSVCAGLRLPRSAPTPAQGLGLGLGHAEQRQRKCRTAALRRNRSNGMSMHDRKFGWARWSANRAALKPAKDH